MHGQVVGAARNLAMDRPLVDDFNARIGWRLHEGGRVAAKGPMRAGLTGGAESSRNGLILRMASLDHLGNVAADRFLG